MDDVCEAICQVVAEDAPTNCRSVFYRLVSRGVIEKNEREYQNTVVRLLTKLRRAGTIPFRSITDGTRLRRKPDSFDCLADALDNAQAYYRRSLWSEQNAYVEVWSEKEAIAGVLLDVTYGWDVPLLVTRGYPSLTYLHSAAAEIEAQNKPAFLYYFGDHDPSGVDISRKVEEELRAFAPHAFIHFERVAVTPEQIEEMKLPTRPTKKSDSRSRGFSGRSVEVDAIPPATLRELARAAIEQHVDFDALRRLEQIQELERDTLASIARGQRLAGVGGEL